MKLKFNYILMVVMLALMPVQLSCQAIFDTLNLKEFEVIADHPESGNQSRTQSIDSIQMSEFSQQDLGELLAALTPLYIKSYGRGTLSTVSFRGSGSTHTQVLWEGFQLNSPMLGQVDFSQVPMAFFSDVELLFGGASLEKSGGALGGSVNLSSNFIAGEIDKTIQLEQTVGSFNTYLTSLGIHLKRGKVSSFTKIIRQTSDNDFVYNNNSMLPVESMKQQSAGFENVGFLQKFSIQLKDNQHLYLMTWNQWSDRDLPPIMTNVFKLQEEYQTDMTSRTILGWKKTGRRVALQVKGAYFFENYHYYLKTISQDTDSKNLINSGFVKADVIMELGKGFLMTTGVELEHQSVNSLNYNGIKTRNRVLAKAVVEKTFFNRLALKLVLREEYSDDSFLPLLPYFGASYKPFEKEALFIRFNVSRNYKRPTLNELYFYPVGNINLLPEKAFELEAGIDFKHDLWAGQSISIGFTGYYSSVKDWIHWNPSNYEPWFPENIPEVVSQGLEASLHWQANVQDWELGTSLQYAFTRTTDRSHVDQEHLQLPYIPVYQGNGFISLAYYPYFVRWNISYTGERATTLDAKKNEINMLPGYWLNHITFGRTFQIRKLDLEARIKMYNIFDVNYQAVVWRAMPKRYADLTVKIKL
ncbi:MAG: hypothetical protein COW63_07950 [Bacteroidetes bacterium CG18_big_fil_WC_8_21_14_2_50_41_14]|nr:MAG: hypothetical protein COW63_07950 [Bacteroidetes bacterium CG18_big_fil_WC_8_21_14_2_50_41_14]PJB55084.1 MAG: hypothetical protein CO098_18140 [Bacteroidetes bacterium CG_4_9_14_3_um_filter_41_19]